MGDFACPGGGLSLSDWGVFPDRAGEFLTSWGSAALEGEAAQCGMREVENCAIQGCLTAGIAM